MNASLDDTFKVLNFTLLQQIESVTVSSKCGPKLWVVKSTACGPHVSSGLYWKCGGFLNSRCHLGFQDSWSEKSHPWEILSQCWAGLWKCTAFLGMPGDCLGLLSIEQWETLRATLHTLFHLPLFAPTWLDEPDFSLPLHHFILILPLLLLCAPSNNKLIKLHALPWLNVPQHPLLLSWSSI